MCLICNFYSFDSQLCARMIFISIVIFKYVDLKECRLLDFLKLNVEFKYYINHKMNVVPSL